MGFSVDELKPFTSPSAEVRLDMGNNAKACNEIHEDVFSQHDI